MTHSIKQIPGLQYIPDFLDQATHDSVLGSIDALPWLADLKRRVQHYGYKYDYKKRAIDASMKAGELPGWAVGLGQQALDQKLTTQIFDQLIVNEYEPGQGIARHVDCEPCFDNTIMSVSLGTGCVMHFTSLADKSLDIPVLLAPKSAVVLLGEARYKWQHSIRANRSEILNGQKVIRGLQTVIKILDILRQNRTIQLI